MPEPAAALWPPVPPSVIERPPERVAGPTPADGWPLAEPMPMGPDTLAALEGLVRALCPAPPAPWSQDLGARVALGARVFLRYLPPVLGRGFFLLVHTLDLAPIWRLRGLYRLRDMERDAADALLQRLSHSRLKLLRLMVMAARAAVLSVYYDQPEVHDAMGYRPLPFIQQRADLRRRLLDGAVPTDADRVGPSVEVTP